MGVPGVCLFLVGEGIEGSRQLRRGLNRARVEAWWHAGTQPPFPCASAQLSGVCALLRCVPRWHTPWPPDAGPRIVYLQPSDKKWPLQLSHDGWLLDRELNHRLQKGPSPWPRNRRRRRKGRSARRLARGATTVHPQPSPTSPLFSTTWPIERPTPTGSCGSWSTPATQKAIL